MTTEENNIDFLCGRLDKANSQRDYLLARMQLAFDIMEAGFSQRRFETAAEILEEALNAYETID